MKLQFRVKVKPDGSFNIPAPKTTHVTDFGGVAVTDIRFRMECKKLQKKGSDLLFRGILRNVNNLPSGMKPVEEGFIPTVEVDTHVA